MSTPTKSVTVGDFVRVDDFAAARNAALARAREDYAFWLDADEVVDPSEGEKLRELLAGLGRVHPGAGIGGPHIRSTHPTVRRVRV
jgi:glycosyltransferase involved in cell wall biosynthesis